MNVNMLYIGDSNMQLKKYLGSLREDLYRSGIRNVVHNLSRNVLFVDNVCVRAAIDSIDDTSIQGIKFNYLITYHDTVSSQVFSHMQRGYQTIYPDKALQTILSLIKGESE
jgi:hypothetical protein